ncbi:MAG: hypothetical protein KF878_10750 [Planctomycetes bacterium]|nr:hypothetical protein [Planctomycetota bacterium]
MPAPDRPILSPGQAYPAHDSVVRLAGLRAGYPVRPDPRASSRPRTDASPPAQLDAGAVAAIVAVVTSCIWLYVIARYFR